MKLNKDIFKELKRYNIGKAEGICYLLSIYFGYEPIYIPDLIKKKIIRSKIVVKKSDTELKWNMPLFKGQETAFQWVKTEYIPLFEAVNPEKAGNATACVRRMKDFFKNFPEYRKDDVLNATKLYIRNKDPKYIRECHYFIKKGRGVSQTRDLLTWVEKYKKHSESTEGNHISNTMQE